MENKLIENVTRVKTPHGEGTYIGEDLFARSEKRYKIKLDKNPFSFPIACYWQKEIIILEDIKE